MIGCEATTDTLGSEPMTANFDDVDPAELRATPSSKWHRWDLDVVPVWVADMDFKVAPPIDAAVRALSDSGRHMYPRFGLYEELGHAYADRARARYGVEVDPAMVLRVSEVVQAMHAVSMAFSQPGDGVLILTPIYPPFLAVPAAQRRALVDHRMVRRDGTYTFDPDALRAEVAATRPKVLLLCNPHNPVGRVYSEAELRVLADLVVEFDLVCVADEIHSDLVFAPHRHFAFASLGAEVAARTITVTSASKAFNLAGLRCAVMVFGSAALRERFNVAVPEAVLGVPSVAGMVATITAWRECDDWLAACLDYLDGNRRFVAAELARRLPEVGHIVPEGTYLSWLDFSALPGMAAPTGGSVGERLREEGRVALNEGPTFGSGLEAFARLNFATSRAVLTEAIDRIERWVDRFAR